jgi:threonine/homoserine/homoserine lactone efflux protein
MNHSLWAFLGISILMIIIPGPDTALSVRNSLAGGRGAGLATALGVVAAQLVWEFGTALGVTALLLASERLFHVVKIAGAVYLIVLGAQALLSALRRRGAADRDAPTAAASVDAWRAFRQGAISNLGNPKMAVYFASIFPQFAPRGHATFAGCMTLGLLFSALTLAWLSLYAVAISHAAGWFRRVRVRRAMETVTGVALIGLGARLALEKD